MLKKVKNRVRKIPQRTCMGCNLKKDKTDLIRIVKNKLGEIKVDYTGKMEGRGTYICKSEDCLNKAIKNKRISKMLEAEINDDIYENLRKCINGGEFIG